MNRKLRITIGLNFIILIFLIFLNYNNAINVKKCTTQLKQIKSQNEQEIEYKNNNSYTSILKDLYLVPFLEIENIDINNKDSNLVLKIKYDSNIENFIADNHIKNLFKDNKSFNITNIDFHKNSIAMTIEFHNSPQ